MSSRIKLNDEDVALLPANATGLLDLPTDCIASPLLDQLDLTSAVALRMVCRRLRVEFNGVLLSLPLLRPQHFTIARGDAPSMPMYEWLRDECPQRWYKPVLWLKRALERSEFNAMDYFLPLNAELPVPTGKLHICVFPCGLRPLDNTPNCIASIRETLLLSAAHAADWKVADWLTERRLLGTVEDLFTFLAGVVPTPLQSYAETLHMPFKHYGPVARRAVTLMGANAFIITTKSFRKASMICARYDDVDFIEFLDTFIGEPKYKALNRFWQSDATLEAAEHNSKKVLAWALARAQDPDKLVDGLCNRATPMQERTLRRALRMYSK